MNIELAENNVAQTIVKIFTLYFRDINNYVSGFGNCTLAEQ